MTHAVAASLYCRNCSLFLGESPGNFCPNCGQDTAAHPPSAWEFLHEFLSHYVAIEGKLTRSLGLLMFRPGELTQRYMAGRKNSYVLPLRLYLTASIVFFLLVKIFGAGNLVKNEVDKGSTNNNVVVVDKATATKKGLSIGKPGGIASASVSDESVLHKPFLEVFRCESIEITSPEIKSPEMASFGSLQCNKIKAFMTDKYQGLTVSQVGRQVKDRTISLAPYAMFACLPLFALFTRTLYFNRRMYYGEHLVYAFHVHAFAFLLLLAIALTPHSVSEWLYLVGAIYFWMAMRRVFGGRWLPTLLRYALIGVLYPMLMALVIGVTLIAAVFV